MTKEKAVKSQGRNWSKVIQQDIAPATKRTRKNAPSSIPYAAEHYEIMRMAGEAGVQISTDTHPSIADVEKFAKFADLAADLVITKHEANKKTESLSPFVSREELIKAIKNSQRSVTVCVPDRSYYASGDNWSSEDIEFVDAELFLYSLETGR